MAAARLPISGVAAMAIPVRLAPSRCWLNVRNVHPKKNCTTPARAKARNAQAGARPITDKSWVSADPVPSAAVAIMSKMNVAPKASMNWLARR